MRQLPRRAAGFACDFLAIAAAEVGAIAERRTDRLLDPARSHGLPPFLAADPGVDSGLMIAQYTQAALVAENRRLAAPASVGSIPTSAMQEDHVSMGWGAARKLAPCREPRADPRDRAGRAPPAGSSCARRCARRGDRRGARRLREAVPGPGPDRYLAPELAAAEQLVRSGALWRGRGRDRDAYVTPAIEGSEIARLPVFGSYGAALVMSSFSAVVATGSNVIVDGWFGAPANVTCWPLTGTHWLPLR